MLNTNRTDVLGKNKIRFKSKVKTVFTRNGIKGGKIMNKKDAEFVNKCLADSVRKGYLKNYDKVKSRKKSKPGTAHQSIEIEKDYIGEFMDTYML